MTKLNPKKVKWITDEVVIRGVDTATVAKIQGISQRRVQQLVKYYKEHGNYYQLKMTRRPKKELTVEEKKIIDEAFKESQLGARLLHYHIKKHYGTSISHNKIHAYLLKKGKARQNPKKQKKRKRKRYERKHAFSSVHADWTYYKGKWVIAYLDDSTRYILAIGEFEKATTKNALTTLAEAEKEAESFNDYIRAINTDRGSQFYANGGEKKKKGLSLYQRTLQEKGIKHIVSRKNNPQTNGKLERWFQEYKKHRHRFNSKESFKNWYNSRIHGALCLEWGETPEEAVLRKLKPECLLGLFFKNIAKK